MPISRAIKAVKRTTPKDLDKVPESIKDILDTDVRAEKVGEFFEQDKTQELASERVADIGKEQGVQQERIQRKQEQIEARTVPEDFVETPFPDRETFLREQELKLQYEEKALRAKEQAEADKERMFDLYTKARDLKLEKERTEIFNQRVAEGMSPAEAFHSQVSTTPGAGNKHASLEGRSDALYNRVSGPMTELKDELRTKWFGITRNEALADDIVRYLKDGKVKDKSHEAMVKKISKQWEDAANMIKSLRNKAGARIGKLEDWIMPQSHDSRKIFKAKYKTWSKDIKKLLDIERIEKEQGGKIDDILETAYGNITRKKTVKAPKGTGAKVIKRGEESRVLHFKDGDSILKYNEMYGNPDIYSTMDAHIRAQTNEIAGLQLFGSNPELGVEKLQELAGLGDWETAIKSGSINVALGKTDGDNMIKFLDYWMGTISGTFRSIAIGSKLGTATVSSLADISNMVIGAGYRGLSSVRMLGKGLDTLLQEAVSIGTTAENVKIASRIGVVSEFASASLANSRFAETGAGWAQKSAEVVIRSSGLGAYTNSMKTAFGLEFAGSMAENFGKKFDDVPFKGMFDEYGITPDEWDIIRKSETYKVKGAEFFDNNKLYDLDEGLGYKVNEMITNEMNAFVISPTSRTRGFTTWGRKKGTPMGETARNIMLFKSFPIAITMMHMNRLGKIDGALGKTAYVGAVLGANTIMGTITLWAYDIVTGTTPREADPTERWQIIPEAITKAGALGIFGDIFSGVEESRYGHSFAETLLGVPATTLDDIIKTGGELVRADMDAEDKVGAIYHRAKTYIPGQNLWYTRALIEQSVGDFFGKMLDPKHEERKRKQEKRLRLQGKERVELFRD